MERAEVKLATYMLDKTITCGMVTAEGIIDIPSSCKGPVRLHSVKEILLRGSVAFDILAQIVQSPGKIVSPDEVRMLAPVPRPGKLLALAGNYIKHILEGGKKLGLSDSPHDTTVPRPFLMPSTVVTGTHSTVPWPTFSDQVDYELELAVMIGRNAKAILPEQAPHYIAGYMIANDISARRVTFKAGRAERPWDEFFDWLNGKWSDGFLPLGPYLVTADEIADPQNLDMELKVNGEVRQRANTSQMIFSVAEIVSFLSHLMTLEPGDVIATGTPHGVGMADGRFLAPGDKIECAIQGLDVLVNTLGPKPNALYQPLCS
ncbi:MAG: fumarylacetoacetate hydrolase family protein [Sedimentisphaerales bacterium]|nr:fumarylacetoacetate hydrolase family protein [Sedimentisphaerales bacterium]